MYSEPTYSHCHLIAAVRRHCPKTCWGRLLETCHGIQANGIRLMIPLLLTLRRSSNASFVAGQVNVSTDLQHHGRAWLVSSGRDTENFLHVCTSCTFSPLEADMLCRAYVLLSCLTTRFSGGDLWQVWKVCLSCLPGNAHCFYQL